MSLNNPVLTGPGAGRTVTNGSGSSTELKLEGEQAGGDWAVVEWHLRAGDEPPIHTHTWRRGPTRRCRRICRMD